LDGDGYNDILVTSGQGLTNGISIFIQDSANPGTFINPTYYSPSFQPYGCAIGDLNNDINKRKDVIVAAEKDAEVFAKVAEVADGERVLLNSVTLDMAEARTLEDCWRCRPYTLHHFIATRWHAVIS
jgi:hypothetical protein